MDMSRLLKYAGELNGIEPVSTDGKVVCCEPKMQSKALGAIESIKLFGQPLGGCAQGVCRLSAGCFPTGPVG